MRNTKSLEFFYYNIGNVVEFSTSEMHYFIKISSYKNKEGVVSDVRHTHKLDGVHEILKEKFSNREDVMVPNVFSYWRNNNSKEVIEQKRINLIGKINDRIEFVEKALVDFSCGHIKSVSDKVNLYYLIYSSCSTYDPALAAYINEINKKMYITHEEVTDHEYFLIRTMESNSNGIDIPYTYETLDACLITAVYDVLSILHRIKSKMGYYFDVLLCIYPLRNAPFFADTELCAEEESSIRIVNSKRAFFVGRYIDIFNELKSKYDTENLIFTGSDLEHKLRNIRVHRKYVLDAIHMTLLELDSVHGTNELLAYYTSDVSKHSYFLHFVKLLESFYLKSVGLSAFHKHSSSNIYLSSYPIFVLEEVPLLLYEPSHLSLDTLDNYLEMNLLTINLSTNLMKYSTFDINSPMVSGFRKESVAFYKKKKKRVRR